MAWRATIVQWQSGVQHGRSGDVLNACSSNIRNPIMTAVKTCSLDACSSSTADSCGRWHSGC
jgi:hypothetical protein